MTCFNGKPLMDVQALQRDLESQIDGEVRFDKVSRALYSTDASVYQIEPTGVVVVKSREDIVRAVNICKKHRCPLTMRGGGTSQAGQAIGEGLQVDTSKYFNRLLEVNAAERWARVEPGIVLDELNAALRPHNLRFAPDISTASRATVGGMMANNSSGARSVMYGKTIDHVLEQEVVLSDGSVVHFRPLARADVDAICQQDTLEAACYREVRRLAATHADEIDRRFPEVLRRVGGYNLDDFVDPDATVQSREDDRRLRRHAGHRARSETRARPAAERQGGAGDSVRRSARGARSDAGDSSRTIRPRSKSWTASSSTTRSRAPPSIACDAPSSRAIRRRCCAWSSTTTMRADLPARLEAIERDLRARRFGYRYFHALDLATQATIWSLREAALGLSMAMKDDAKSLSFVEDTAVAPEKLRDYIDRFLAIVKRHKTTAGVYAHASVGCLHVRPVINMKTAEGVQTFESLANDVADLVLEFGGALSGEHGDGLVRGPFMEKMFGTTLYEAFRAVKHTFDPDGIFNPGKIVDCPPMTQNLRYGAGYQTPRPETFFDYDEYGGMAGAVEMCSGLGACRKTLDGTMCPSYMATKEESHSTRGRANVLRLAMAGRLNESGLGDEGVKEVMSLCLECRACKAECPVGVDVARFKSEFLADYWKRHGTSLRARVLGHIHDLSHWGSRFAPLSNTIARSAPVRWINEQLLGLDSRRTPPAWASTTFSEHFARLFPASGEADSTANPPTFVFNDTFTNFYNPDIGMAGVKVLHNIGCRPALAPNGCCGRPLISQGLLSEARELAARNTVALFPLAERGHRILFFEPSCLSAVREDAPSLLRGDEQRRARRVAEASMLFEEFVESAWPKTTTLKAGPTSIQLHGHCHQKAMGLVAPAKALLSRIPGATVVDLNAGCCGMAGSFGYVRDHLRRVAGHRRTAAAARRAKLEGWVGARRERRLLPPSS